MITHYKPYSIARLPRIEFGSGKFGSIAKLAAGYGKNILLVTGAVSFLKTEHWQKLQTQFKKYDLGFDTVNINGEPSPEMVDDAVRKFANHNIEVVIGIGGGSTLDAAKAIAGLLKVNRSVMDYLEGVGPELKYEGPSVPLIAVPTTAGTGSEATKNAVLSKQGANGFKKSFRDDKLVAEYAIVDPDLLTTCPKQVIAANGMDALTQLIESYISLQANAFNDALCISGLVAARDGLLALYNSEGQDKTARERMAYASMISGISLAQTGLGSVHGLASPLGAYYPIPHGVVCGTLVSIATEININAMSQREPNNPALQKYAHISEILCQIQHPSNEDAWQRLIELLHLWTIDLNLEKLSHFGLQTAGLDKVVANSRGSSMKTNPIVLTDKEIKAILVERL